MIKLTDMYVNFCIGSMHAHYSPSCMFAICSFLFWLLSDELLTVLGNLTMSWWVAGYV